MRVLQACFSEKALATTLAAAPKYLATLPSNSGYFESPVAIAAGGEIRSVPSSSKEVSFRALKEISLGLEETDLLQAVLGALQLVLASVAAAKI